MSKAAAAVVSLFIAIGSLLVSPVFLYAQTAGSAAFSRCHRFSRIGTYPA
jgi:hypothetical protein